MRIQIELRRPNWLPARLSWRARIAAAAGALLVIAVPTAWASHRFADVPDSEPFHAQIDAIAMAGITTGCGPGAYCPEDAVTRKAMAAFMHRGFGRVAFKFLPAASVPASSATPAGWTLSITPGLPAGALAGAAGFVKVDGVVSVCNNTTTARGVRAGITVDGALITSDNTYLDLDVDSSPGECGNLSLLGVARVTAAGARTAAVVISGGDGASVLADGHLALTYFPFGSTGTNAFVQSTPPDGGSIDR